MMVWPSARCNGQRHDYLRLCIARGTAAKRHSEAQRADVAVATFARRGQADIGAWSCGMVAGLIHDIPSVAQLIQRIMADAEAIIAERLSRLLPQRKSVA